MLTIQVGDRKLVSLRKARGVPGSRYPVAPGRTPFVGQPTVGVQGYQAVPSSGVFTTETSPNPNIPSTDRNPIPPAYPAPAAATGLQAQIDTLRSVAAAENRALRPDENARVDSLNAQIKGLPVAEPGKPFPYVTGGPAPAPVGPINPGTLAVGGPGNPGGVGVPGGPNTPSTDHNPVPGPHAPGTVNVYTPSNAPFVSVPYKSVEEEAFQAQIDSIAVPAANQKRVLTPAENQKIADLKSQIKALPVLTTKLIDDGSVIVVDPQGKQVKVAGAPVSEPVVGEIVWTAMPEGFVAFDPADADTVRYTPSAGLVRQSVFVRALQVGDVTVKAEVDGYAVTMLIQVIPAGSDVMRIVVPATIVQ